jgi:hypothetical protein
MKFGNAGAAVSTVSRRRRVRLCALVPLFALVILLVPHSLAARAEAFDDLRRSADIDAGWDLGGTGHWALNFTGWTGSAGDAWMSVVSRDLKPELPFFSLSADVLIHKFNNKKGAGLLALYNEGAGKKGLALILYDAGNSDTLVLATVDQNGRLATLKSLALGPAIIENAWYRVTMDVSLSGGDVSVYGRVFRHTSCQDADSLLDSQVGTTLYFGGTLPAGVDPSGEFGVVASAVSAQVDSSVANFLFAIPGPF